REPSLPQAPPQPADPRSIKRCPVALLGKSLPQHTKGLRRDPHCLHAVVTPNLDDQPRYVRMKVHVLVGVDVVKRPTGCVERFELRADLARKLAANLWKD